MRERRTEQQRVIRRLFWRNPLNSAVRFFDSQRRSKSRNAEEIKLPLGKLYNADELRHLHDSSPSSAGAFSGPSSANTKRSNLKVEEKDVDIKKPRKLSKLSSESKKRRLRACSCTSLIGKQRKRPIIQIDFFIVHVQSIRLLKIERAQELTRTEDNWKKRILVSTALLLVSTPVLSALPWDHP